MKLLVLLSLAALALAAPNQQGEQVQVVQFQDVAVAEQSADRSSILINALVRQLIAYVRRVINEGSSIFGVPPMDPLELEHLNINIPAGIINLGLELEDVYASGFGGFVDYRTDLNVRELTFDIDIGVPLINLRAGKYNLIGDLFTAIPLYGNGEALFEASEFRFRAKLFLKQSDNEKSVIIDHLENISFEIPQFKSRLTGVIGGGDIDAIVNAIVEEVIVDYINRFQGAISLVAGKFVIAFFNPVLEQLDTWRYIAPFV